MKTTDKLSSTPSVNKTESQKPKKEISSWIFFFISCVISSLLFFNLGGGNLYWWDVLVIPIYALWLTGPVTIADVDYSKREQIISYIGWVAIQSIILFLGVNFGITGPPEGIGVPHF